MESNALDAGKLLLLAEARVCDRVTLLVDDGVSIESKCGVELVGILDVGRRKVQILRSAAAEGE